MNPPRSKFRYLRGQPGRPSRRAYGMEELEPRNLPSVTLPGVASTEPADGAVVVQAPQAFSITFNPSAADQDTSDFSDLFGIPADQVLPTVLEVDSGEDVEIQQVGPDGSTSPVLGGSSAWSVQESIATTTAPDGTTVTQLVISPQSGSPILSPGTYQLDVMPQTFLDEVFDDGSGDSPWFTAMNPMPIAQFTVLGPGVTLTGATDLGTIGPASQTAVGFIEPEDAQSAVELYRFTLPQGSSWQFGAQVDTTSIGSSLLSALSLLDAQGNVLETTGSAADPIDPGLVASLGPGTYYIGVSGSGNLAGSPGGYDPVTGTPGITGLGDTGGPFVLDLTATPAPQPTRLVGLHLDYADTLESSPTGLDLTFSGSVDASTLAVPDVQETALTVVDAQGQTWPITAVNYVGSQHRLSFIFDEALPAGTYSLVEPSRGGLTDLSGDLVVGAAGSQPGVLAKWTIAPGRPALPQNLGVLWPGPANVTWSPTVSSSATVNAGQTIDDRFVVICPGLYQIQTQISAGAVNLSLRGGDRANVLDAGGVTGSNDTYVFLEPGVYQLRLANEGSQSSFVELNLTPYALDYDQILANGVGQSPVLGLPVFGPEANGPVGSTTAGSPTLSASPGLPPVEATAAAASPGATSPAVTSPGATSPSSGSIFSPIPPALLVTLETGLVGLPAPEAGHELSLQPLSTIADIATGDARGLSPGIASGLWSSTDARVGEGDQGNAPDSMTPSPPELVGQVQTAAIVQAAEDSAQADAIAVARADRLVRLAGWFGGRDAGTLMENAPSQLAAGEFVTNLVGFASGGGRGVSSVGEAVAWEGSGRRRDAFSQADLGAPLTLLVGTALSFRLSRPIRKWWRRQHTAHTEWPRPFLLRRGVRPGSGRLRAAGL